MFKDKITVRIQTRFRKLHKDHATPFRQKCRQAREIILQVYQDQELCITENLIKRANYLKSMFRGGFHSLLKADPFYTQTFELEIINRWLEAVIGGNDAPAPGWPPDAPEAPAQEPAETQAPFADSPVEEPEKLPEPEAREESEAMPASDEAEKLAVVSIAP